MIGTQLHNPNFVRLAESYGAQAMLANYAAMPTVVLQAALLADRPVVIEVSVGPLEQVY